METVCFASWCCVTNVVLGQERVCCQRRTLEHRGYRSRISAIIHTVNRLFSSQSLVSVVSAIG